MSTQKQRGMPICLITCLIMHPALILITFKIERRINFNEELLAIKFHLIEYSLAKLFTWGRWLWFGFLMNMFASVDKYGIFMHLCHMSSGLIDHIIALSILPCGYFYNNLYNGKLSFFIET